MSDPHPCMIPVPVQKVADSEWNDPNMVNNNHILFQDKKRSCATWSSIAALSSGPTRSISVSLVKGFARYRVVDPGFF